MPYSKKVQGLNPVWGLSVFTCFCVCVGFLPQSKNIHRVVNVRENGCLSVSITGDLSRVYPVSCPITSGTGSRPPTEQNFDKDINGHC